MFLSTIFFSATATFGSCWFQCQSNLAVHFSFTFRLLLPVSSHSSGDFSLANCKHCYTSHIFRDPSACEPRSKRPKCPPICIVCLFFTEVLKKICFQNHRPLNTLVFRRDMRIQNFLREKSQCSSQKNRVIRGFSAFFHTDSSNLSWTPIAV